MKIPRYWTKGTFSTVDADGHKHTFEAWGWSSDSVEAAREHGAQRAQRVYDRFSNDMPQGDYDYLEHPLREEVVETLGDDGQPLAVITRNRYGALVLNTASVCFIDVDFSPPEPSGIWEMLLMLFSSARREQKQQAAEQAAARRVAQWALENPHRAFRLYRTRAGLRLLFIDRLYDPTSREVYDLLVQLGSDRLYRRLTEKQQSFRARLTPKPWRCDCTRPPVPYPWRSPEAERLYRDWQRRYESKAQAYGVCRLIDTFGSAPADGSTESIDQVVALHDRYTLRGDSLPLA